MAENSPARLWTMRATYVALALAIFVLGAALVVLGVYAITAIAYGLRRRGARA